MDLNCKMENKCIKKKKELTCLFSFKVLGVFCSHRLFSISYLLSLRSLVGTCWEHQFLDQLAPPPPPRFHSVMELVGWFSSSCVCPLGRG